MPLPDYWRIVEIEKPGPAGASVFLWVLEGLMRVCVGRRGLDPKRTSIRISRMQIAMRGFAADGAWPWIEAGRAI
ncbi:MAG: hypothetical protein Q4G62_04110 [Pseudomonadota bacterium]|nr:hypothetical protein [Pseudomonadota bacterium]